MIKEFEKRTSVRYFLNKEIEPEKINKLKEIINLSPTSMNCQAFSAIFITDQKIKEELSYFYGRKRCKNTRRHIDKKIKSGRCTN